MFFLFYYFKRASRSHAKTGFFRPQKQSSHAGKSHFFRKSQVFRFFVFFKNDVLPAWELNFRKLDQHFYVFLRFLEMLKKHVFTCLSFSCFYIIFSVFLEALGLLLASFWSLCRLFGFLVSSFRVPLTRLGCLWTLTATFCGPFGSSGLSVGSGTAPGLFFASFPIDFGVIF